LFGDRVTCMSLTVTGRRFRIKNELLVNYFCRGNSWLIRQFLDM